MLKKIEDVEQELAFEVEASREKLINQNKFLAEISSKDLTVDSEKEGTTSSNYAPGSLITWEKKSNCDVDEANLSDQSPEDLWRRDLEKLLVILNEAEVAEQENLALIAETTPSAKGRRINPFTDVEKAIASPIVSSDDRNQAPTYVKIKVGSKPPSTLDAIVADMEELQICRTTASQELTLSVLVHPKTIQFGHRGKQPSIHAELLLEPGAFAEKTRRNPYTVTTAFPISFTASGWLYVYDGMAADQSAHDLIQFTLTSERRNFNDGAVRGSLQNYLPHEPNRELCGVVQQLISEV
ncbi:hypothetical protein DAPPUDRAFT_238663 [Daphnia pulex]|uniref:Uncharacterized protein n=1 Tax=Daphnia pulex TaxID=6669 RepID=E9G730_DAPPU|nr:hypothetical protein DAPPUDRAFT_238663 [Daphnia pulex]|eukprot:EFX84396.1 hypothetical protein DAPPUDRAFT_238663 [Daphnia pulex]